MIKKLACWILRDYLSQLDDRIAELRNENSWLYNAKTQADQRWVELNQVMVHRAQQQRGEVCVRQGREYMEILAVKTSPGGIWEISVK